MKIILIIALLLCSIGVKAQKIKPTEGTGASIATTTTNFINGSYPSIHSTLDTVQVLAYCLIDADTPTFIWLKAYAIYGLDYPYVNFNGIMIYKKYLTLHGKEPFPFKVVYAITKP